MTAHKNSAADDHLERVTREAARRAAAAKPLAQYSSGLLSVEDLADILATIVRLEAHAHYCPDGESCG